MQKDFERKKEALDEIFSFIDDFVSEKGVKKDVVFSLKLVIEELFINLVIHNTGGMDHITISLKKANNQLIIQLKDYDVDAFDISDVEEVDIRESLEGRDVGGLGIHLVKSIIEKITYEYTDRTMSVTAIKNLEEEDV